MPLEVRKYRLENMATEPSRQAIMMPFGATILSIQEQNGVMVLWAAIDPAADCEARFFALVKSGRPLDGIDINNYVGTVQTHGSSPVWHVFEV